MNLTFHPDAENEFTNSINYYEDIEKGLGLDFAIEVHSTIKRITSFPKAWSIIEEDIRQALINRFPYSVLYTFEKGTIFILAVMHSKRKPRY
ncbi:MAG: type II toxin-antitoxin system RelE/ParE family toxin [Melioribacteraceae bacterium]